MLFTKSNVLEGLGSAEVCGVRQAAGLQVFGLKWPGANGHDYLTLDEALEQRTLEVTEVDAGGRVPTLKVANKSGRMVFLMAGGEVVGRKEDGQDGLKVFFRRAARPVPRLRQEAGRVGRELLPARRLERRCLRHRRQDRRRGPLRPAGHAAETLVEAGQKLRGGRTRRA